MKYLNMILVAYAVAVVGGFAAQQTTLTQREVRDPRQLQTILESNALDAESRLAAAEGGTSIGLASNLIFVGQSTAKALGVAVSGDLTVATNGAFTVADEAITLAKMADIATLSVIGRSTADAGVPEVLTAATDHFVLRRSGAAMGFGLLVNANLDAAAAIAHTKLAAVDPAYLLVGNATSQAVAVAVSGDVTMTDAGAFALASGVVAPAELTADLADEILYVTVTGADAATNGTGTVTIQVKDAAGADLDESVVIRTWIGTADDYGPDALTDYSVSTGTLLQEVTANAQYVVVTDTNGVAVMAVDFDGSGAGTVYAWAEIQGKIGASGILELTAP